MTKERERKDYLTYLLLFSLLIFPISLTMIDRETRIKIKSYFGITEEPERYPWNVYVIYMGLSVFSEDCGRLPTDEEGLKPLFEDTGISGWRGPYLISKANPVVDKWGSEFYYDYIEDEKKGIIGSCGPDRIKDTEDDIVEDVY